MAQAMSSEKFSILSRKSLSNELHSLTKNSRFRFQNLCQARFNSHQIDDGLGEILYFCRRLVGLEGIVYSINPCFNRFFKTK
jgi:hypothetical protein